MFLLEQLENYDNKERVDVINLISSNELNVEHIMPQTLTPKWRKELGSNYEYIYEKYLHTIGNITLTGYNSKMSNKPFLEKKEMEKGFNESRLNLNKYLQKLDRWNEESIKKRANILKKKAIKIWGFPETNYVSEQDKLKTFTLSEDYKNFAGEKIISFTFIEDKHKSVKSWKDFYKKVCAIIYEFDPILFKQIIIDNKFIYKEKSTTNIKDHIKIDDFYVYGILDTETMLARLRTIFENIDLDLDDLSFVIK